LCIHCSKISVTTIATNQGYCKIGGHWIIWRRLFLWCFEEDYSSEWSWCCLNFAIPKKNGTVRTVTKLRKLNLLLKHKVSHISYSKDWVNDHLNWKVYLFFQIGLKYGVLSHQTRYWCRQSRDMYNFISVLHRKLQIQALTHGYQEYPGPDGFQGVMSKLVQDMENVKNNLLYS
jgi:hypothetical protein